jgi:hypothetical protein
MFNRDYFDPKDLDNLGSKATVYDQDEIAKDDPYKEAKEFVRDWYDAEEIRRREDGDFSPSDAG